MMLDDFAGENDITAVREIPLPSGNTMFLSKMDPYGFFRFSLAKGSVPDWMKGDYTSLGEAQKALQQYLAIRHFDKEPAPQLASPKGDTNKKPPNSKV